MEASKMTKHPLIIEEWNGSSSTKLFKTATITFSPSLQIQRSVNGFNHVWRRFLDAFVPEASSSLPGFPGSVTPDYVPFQVWDSLQALLSAIGVGEKSATIIGATFQWFLRDLTGMLGGILFTLYQGSNLDSNAKMWRLVADLMNDLASVASGATRAALTQHFALQNNAADIAAKEGSQETMATMIGMALGMLLARITTGNPVSTMEHVLPLWTTLRLSKSAKPLHTNVKLGLRVSTLDHSEIPFIDIVANSSYIVTLAKYLLVERKGTVSVVVHKDSTAEDILKSYIHALVMVNLTVEQKSLHLECQSWMDKHYESFVQ
ncbi:hypothetical protein Goarm_006995, partial [Gossypium armourianum]|nr:hypothetical protein [Gossypium armourianum]